MKKIYNTALTPDASVRLPTEKGDFLLNLYLDPENGKEHLALISGQVAAADSCLVRIHSECFTGDVLGSTRCDCGPQLNHAIEAVAQAPAGVVIYLRQEGRGIGLLEKLKAYGLQDEGFDTVEANVMLGHEPDERDYSIAAGILKGLGVGAVRLITNNPDKVQCLLSHGLIVEERVASPLAVHDENKSYLKTKASKLRHVFEHGVL